MARAYQCDRCGAFFSRRNLATMYDLKYRSSDMVKDLCPECNAELDEWFRNNADFVPKKEEAVSDVQSDV